MNELQILAEVKKAIDFKNDGTYEEKEFYSHILTIIKENSDTGAQHKHQLERLIFKVDELRENQRLYWGGHKDKLKLCKDLETAIDKKIMYMCGPSGGYTIERFKQEKPQQTRFF
jgi:hypothetical protein